MRQLVVVEVLMRTIPVWGFHIRETGVNDIVYRQKRTD
jgi:hypothetical protein